MTSEPALAAELLVAGATRPRLQITFRLDEGVTVMSGPSGSGKSTCLLSLAGLVRPARGYIQAQDRTLYDSQRGVFVPARERRVALVFQTLALFPHLTVQENVAFGVDYAQSRRERGDIAAQWLERMHIPGLAARMPATLSGGEAQRVALARALASRPTLLLLDEPFSALDEALRRELASEVCAVVEALHIPALLVTHEPHTVPRASAHLRLRAGELDDG